MEKSRVISFKNKLCVLLVSLAILLGVVFSFKSTSVTKVDAITTSDTTSYVKVGELFDTNTKQFNKTNYQILKNYITGKAGATATDLTNLISSSSPIDADNMRRKTISAGSYNGTSYSSKTTAQDIEVTLGGLDWQVMYLSTDKSGNPILTLWLDNCVQDAWTARSATEGDHYGFYQGGLYSDYSYNWISDDGVNYNYVYPPNMYGTSYINAVTLNNGGVYVKSSSATLTTATKSSTSAFALFTMDDYGLTDYLVTPRQVSWQETQSAFAYAGTDYDFANDAWSKSYSNDDFPYPNYNYASIDYSDAWADSYLWLPSITEVGDCSGTGLEDRSGLWNTSTSQMENYDGVTTNGYGYVGSVENAQTWSTTWLRSASTCDMDVPVDYARAIYCGGTQVYNSGLNSSLAVRPALHLNLNKVEISANRESIADGSISFASGTNSVFDGTIKSIDVTVNSKTLARGSDYTISYQLGGKTVMSIYDAGTYTVAITGKGNYYGTLTKQITVTPASLVGITLDKTSVTYSGMNIIVSETVSAGDVFGVLNKNVDYAITYSTVEGAVVNELNSANTYKIRATGKGNFTGAVSATFTIESKSIAGASFTCSSATYTGSAVEPPTMTMILDDGRSLRYGIDYSIKYYDSGIAINPLFVVDALTYTINATGKGNYKDSVSTTFTVNPRDISSGSMSVYPLDNDFNGGAQIPTIVVTVNSRELVESTDYTLVYTLNGEVLAGYWPMSEAGEYTITANGEGNYNGSLSATYTITPTALVGITLSSTSETYNGSSVCPTVTVSSDHGLESLVEGEEFEITYKNSAGTTITASQVVNAGTYTIIATGIGNFTGELTATFVVNSLAISDTSITVASIANQTYTGSAINPLPVVKHNGTVLVKNTDYTLSYSNNTNAGEATVTITGIGNFKGSRTIKFTIAPKNIDGNIIINGIESVVEYTGSKVNTSISVFDKDLGTELRPSEYEYALTTDGKSAGYHYYTITAYGNYCGTVYGVFEITQKSISSGTLTVQNTSYTGSVIIPNITLVVDGRTLTKGTDYNVAYFDKDGVKVTEIFNAETYTVVATGKGNYAGEIRSSFTIKAYDIGGLSLPDGGSYQYTGSAITPDTSGILVHNNNYILVEGKDYTIEYSNNTNAGTGTITFTGKGNYTGTKTLQIYIYALDFEHHRELFTFSSPVPEQTYFYTGSEIRPVPEVYYNGIKLVDGVDFDCSYSGNINVEYTGDGDVIGSYASVTITGKGNFSGSHILPFTISPLDISSEKVFLMNELSDCVYTGSEIRPDVLLGFKIAKVVSGTTLEEDTDYTLTYKDNVDAGTATIIITGKGNFTGSREVTFEITAKSISNATVTVGELTYTGNELTPVITVKDGETTLVEGVDYKLVYLKAVNAGSYNIEVFISDLSSLTSGVGMFYQCPNLKT